jgi:hypothetical protein
MKEQYIVTSNGKYIQTKSKYLAHALNYIGFRFMQFKNSEDGSVAYSFLYSKELLATIEHIVELRANNLNCSKSSK